MGNRKMNFVKVTLTKGRSETVEKSADISAASWWQAIKHDGSKFVVLNDTSYTKDEVVHVEQVSDRHGFTNMEGI